MYNRTNLPLSPLKVVKKSIGGLFGSLIFLIFLIPFFGVLYMGASTGGLGERLGYVFFGVLGLIVLNIVGVVVYQYFYYKLYYYNFTEDGAEIKKGVIALATGHVQYARLQNVYVDQDILDRIFGLYDVHYETAGEASSFYSHVDGLKKENADKLVAFLVEKAKDFHNGVAMPSATVETTPIVNASSAVIPDGKTLTIDNFPLGKNYFWYSVISMTFGLCVVATFFTFGLALVLMILVAPIIFVISYIYTKVWIKNFRFDFAVDKGSVFKKVIGQSTTYLYYDRIQNVSVAQGVIARIFGVYAIVVETAGEQSGFHLGIPAGSKESAEAIKNFLLEKARVYRGRL